MSSVFLRSARFMSILLCCTMLMSNFEPSYALSFLGRHSKKTVSVDKVDKAKPEATKKTSLNKKAIGNKPGAEPVKSVSTDKKAVTEKSKATSVDEKNVVDKLKSPKAVKVTKAINPKPMPAASNDKKDKSKDKSEVASVEGFAAVSIEDGAVANAARQSIAKQYYFRNAFIARPSNALSEDQVVLVAKYIQNYNKHVPRQDVRTYAEAIVYFCQFYQVNPKLIAGMIAIESSFRTDAVSSSGAIGLGQLKPDTANWLSVSDPYDPIENIGGMTRYISWLIRKYNGSYDYAVSAYYQGPGTVDRNGITEACLPYLYKVNDALARF